MSIRTLPTTLLPIFCKTNFNFKAIVKSIIDPDDNFWSKCQWINISLVELEVKKEKCQSERYLQFSFKYFLKSFLIWVDISLVELKVKEEKCQSEHSLQLSFKYFVKSFSISKLLSKVSLIQTTVWSSSYVFMG